MTALIAFIGLVVAYIAYRVGYSAGHRNGYDEAMEKSAEISTRNRLGQINWN